MNNQITFGIGGVIIGLVLATAFTPTMFSGFRNGGIGMMSGPMGLTSAPVDGNQNIGGTRMMGNIDRHFIEQMIPHHDGAIAMATLALKKASRPEIKNLASAIIEAQNKEIKDMRGWYKEWFKTDVPNGVSSLVGGGMMSGSGMHMGGQEDMRTLENASDFDKAFIEAMIPHHQLAVMMAQMLKAGTNRLETLSLADNIIESQSKEIQEMQSWYESWYQ